MPLNQKQQEAVNYLEGPLLVLAGPGTGKTQLLSEKVAYILKNTDASPENILCLTFTESGCQNMRDRLKRIVGKDGLKVHIGTYHSFGSDILADYKLYSDSYTRNLESAIDEVTAFKIVKKLRDSLPASDILRGDNVKDIMSTISSAKSANLTAEDLAAIALQNIEDSAVLSKSISPLLKNVVPRKFKESLDGAYRPIYELLKNYNDIPPILKTIDRNIKNISIDLEKAIGEAEASGKITPLTDWRNAYFEKDEKENYRLKDRVANKKLGSLARLMQQYVAYLESNGLFDFDDMIEEAVKALKTDRGFRLSMSEKYQYILLDEFQDTNPSQFEIVKQLTDYEKPMIMAVGDDDQAIYEFQGASATNLTTFREYYNAHVVSLVENYRSTQEILDYAHQVIVQADNRFGDKNLTAHLKNPETPQIFRHEFISSDIEYSFVADSIKNLLASDIEPKDIAIIAPKHKYLLPLLPFLKDRNLNIAYEKRDNLLEDQKIHEILSICRYVYDVAHEKTPSVSLMEILSYAFWQINPLDIVRLIGDAKANHKSTLEYLATSDNENLQKIAKFFGDLVAHSFNDPLEIFLNYLLGTAPLNDFRSPFLSYYGAQNDFNSFTLYENLASLRSKLQKHFSNRQPKLADLLEMVNDYEAAEMQLMSSSPYRDSENAIQILSAHKAKGLEFSYVFIIAADHSAWGKGKGNNNLLSLPKNLLQIRHTGATEGERIRLLYVAITRAKTNLIITSSLRDFSEKSVERLEYLNEDGIIEHQKPVDVEKIEHGIKTWFMPYLDLDPDLRSIYKSRVENLRLSATMLTSFIDIVYAGPTEFFKRQILRAPAEPASDSIVLGNLIHAAFERVTNDHISDAEAEKFFLEELEKAEISPEILADLREKGPIALQTSLSAFGDIIRAANSRAEVDFRSENLVYDGIPLTGKIDHLNIDKTAKTIKIYDFKSGNYHSEKWESQPTLYKYALQLEFYKLLLELSPTYRNYKVSSATILFVSPDKDGEVHQKPYEFTPKSAESFRKLLRAVYAQATSLGFLDDPDLFIEPDSTRNLKDIKSFIELLLAKTSKI